MSIELIVEGAKVEVDILGTLHIRYRYAFKGAGLNGGIQHISQLSDALWTAANDAGLIEGGVFKILPGAVYKNNVVLSRWRTMPR